MSIDLSGQVALVTGANRGIGRQIASDLVASGAQVIAADDFGVSVFIISPGLVATDMTADVSMFDEIPAEEWTPIEKTGALVVELASGKADVLRGRFIHAENDLDELIAHADEIIEQNLQTLGMSFYDDES